MSEPHIDALQERFRRGYTWRPCDGEVTLDVFGGPPRSFGHATVLTRRSDHPHPDTAAPVVVLSRSDYGIAVTELFDLPTERNTVVNLDEERSRRRGKTPGVGA